MEKPDAEPAKVFSRLELFAGGNVVLETRFGGVYPPEHAEQPLAHLFEKQPHFGKLEYVVTELSPEFLPPINQTCNPASIKTH